MAHEATRQQLRDAQHEITNLRARVATDDAAQLDAAEQRGAARAEVLSVIANTGKLALS